MFQKKYPIFVLIFAFLVICITILAIGCSAKNTISAESEAAPSATQITGTPTEAPTPMPTPTPTSTPTPIPTPTPTPTPSPTPTPTPTPEPTPTPIPEPTPTPSIGKIWADFFKENLPQMADYNIDFPQESYDLLVENGTLFFDKDRKANSLDKISTFIYGGDLAKNVSKYYSTIMHQNTVAVDYIKEAPLDSEQTLTMAIVHEGGDVNYITEKRNDAYYYQIFYLGVTNLSKGSSAMFSGVPVGETVVTLTNNTTGNRFNQPMYIVIAGNFDDALDRYLDGNDYE